MDSPSNEKCNSLPSPPKIHHVMLHCWSGGLWGSEKQTNSQDGEEEIKDFYVTQHTPDDNILSLIAD